MRMLRTSVNLQLCQHVASQFVLRHHPSDRMVDEILRLAGLAIGITLQSQPGVASVPSEVPDIHLPTGHPHLFGVDHHYVIAAIDMWGVFRTMLAHQHHRDVARQSSQHLVRSVDDIPILCDFAGLGDVSLLGNHSYERCLGLSCSGAFRLAASNSGAKHQDRQGKSGPGMENPNPGPSRAI